MKISIITVVYNGVSTIEDAITSVLDQTYQDIEYIIIDGGSTDGSTNIINRYSDRITHFVCEKDDGIYDAMNKGIQLASGDIIGILNCDDIYFDNTIIDSVVRSFSDGYDIVYGDLLYVDEYDLFKVVRYWKSTPFIKGYFELGWHPPHPSFFARRKAYESYGKFDLEINISADFDLMLRFLEVAALNSHYIPTSLVRMRVGGESNRSIRKIIQGNLGVLYSFKKNGIKLNPLKYFIRRFFIKVSQFFVRDTPH
jgi:glycosyltransferase involved in cell wall biosynthesis